MALITCYECSKEISDTAQSCLGCGAPVKPNSRPTNSRPYKPLNRLVSLPLFLGNVVLAPIFVWFLLRKGYSTQSRVIGFGWLAIFLLWPALSGHTPDTARQVASTTTQPTTSRPVDQHPESNATSAQVNADIGCKSTYSDEKKDDIFKAKYKDHWFTWSGEVVLLESGEASLNVDHVGTQDLKVEFADKNAGYNLVKGSELKVRFLMKRAGGCFLPFGGERATVVR